MSIVNYRTREIFLKIVYVGPAMSGKTTSMRALHGIMDEKRRTEMQIIDTAGDRTIFFDYFATEMPRVHGFGMKVMTYGAPGQLMYRTTRKAAMMGADAVIFVADSCVGCMDDNITSMAETLELLAELDIPGAPVVLQLNKRDLMPKMPADRMAESLYNRNIISCRESIATESVGIVEPFRDACAAVAKKITDSLESNFGG